MSYRVTPINVAVITKAVVAQLQNDVELNSLRATIERSEDFSDDPSLCPWVGVYRLHVDYPQRQLVGVAGFRSERVQLLILTAASDPTSGENCEDVLEDLNVKVLAALLSDTTLGTVVQGLEEFAVTYTRYSRKGSQYMQTAEIQFVAITNTALTGG